MSEPQYFLYGNRMCYRSSENPICILYTSQYLRCFTKRHPSKILNSITLLKSIYTNPGFFTPFHISCLILKSTFLLYVYLITRFLQYLFLYLHLKYLIFILLILISGTSFYTSEEFMLFPTEFWILSDYQSSSVLIQITEVVQEK